MKDLTDVKVDADGDLIFFSVGLYKLFMAGGKEGQDAKLLYEHLMFTARLQSTNTVRANETYLKNGLGWGSARVKIAKAWLRKHDLIRYVRRRNSEGKVGSVYIKLTWLQAAAAAARRSQDDDEFVEDPGQCRLFDESDAVPQSAEKTSGTGEEQQPELDRSEANDSEPEAIPGQSGEPLSTSGSEIEPVDNQPVGQVATPLDSQTSGFEQQMLQENKEMLEERNSNSLLRPPAKARAPNSPKHQKTVETMQHSESDHTRVRKRFCQEYRERVGVKAPWGSAEGDLLKSDLKRVGADRLIELIDPFMHDRPKAVREFVCEKQAGHGYRVFHTQIDKLLEWQATYRPQPRDSSGASTRPAKCPVCEGSLMVIDRERAKCRGCRRCFDWETNHWQAWPDSEQPYAPSSEAVPDPPRSVEHQSDAGDTTAATAAEELEIF